MQQWPRWLRPRRTWWRWWGRAAVGALVCAGLCAGWTMPFVRAASATNACDVCDQSPTLPAAPHHPRGRLSIARGKRRREVTRSAAPSVTAIAAAPPRPPEVTYASRVMSRRPRPHLAPHDPQCPPYLRYLAVRRSDGVWGVLDRRTGTLLERDATGAVYRFGGLAACRTAVAALNQGRRP